MKVDIIITQLDEHNEGNILATKKFNPCEVYYIIDKNDENNMKSVREYYSNNFKNTKLNEIVILQGDINALSNLVQKVKDKKVIINLTGGKRINSLMLLDICIKDNLLALYINIKDKLMYEFNNGVKLLEESFEDLEIEDIVNAGGGKIVEDSSELCNKKDLVYFSKEIYSNLSIWHKYKQRLYESTIFQHDEINPKRIYINKDNLLKEEWDLVNKILIKFDEMKEIKYKTEGNKIIIDFQNGYLKGFIFKSGTWLEIATNNLVNSIKEIDEAKNGVVFLWNGENKTVRNELDVVAVKDSVPICISCKDSDKYNEMALNELNVYANKIGGDNVYKILVATKEPIKSPVTIRAKEMGIHIVIFDGNENKFINTIKQILKK